MQLRAISNHMAIFNAAMECAFLARAAFWLAV